MEAMPQHKIYNVQTDMAEDRRMDVENLVREAISNPSNKHPQNLARYVKEQCDTRYGGNWNVHVGPSFGR